MIRFNYFVIICYVLYFTTFITGTGSFNPKSGNSNQDPHFETEDSTQTELYYDYQPLEVSTFNGFFQKLSTIKNTINNINDPLLESDSKPDNLIRELERSYVGNFFSTILSTLWSLSLVLTIAALSKRHWFYKNMVAYTMTPSLIFLLINILFSGSKGEIPGVTTHDLIKSGFETVLFLLGLPILFQQFLPGNIYKFLSERKFMAHTSTKQHGKTTQIFQNPFQILYQLLIILLGALFISNFILLPIYLLQVGFTEIFIFIPLLLIFLLAFFYSRAYLNVSITQKADSAPYSGLAFLGLRILRNSFFITTSVLLVLLAIGVIVTITLLNIEFLQTLNLIQKPEIM